ncbi:MAG: SMC-Scp complex subunit ScpB [Patescibacteria group bacterium]
MSGVDRPGGSGPKVGPRLAVESILFAAGEPVKISDLASLVGLPRGEVKQLLADIRKSYSDRGIRLVIGEQEAQLVTAPETEAVVGRFLKQELRGRLSKGALETLAIIAYRGPVTRPEVESIRGVQSSAPLRTLAIRGLIGEVGRRQEPGRPILYDTTIELLKHLGVGGKDELPAVPDELTERLAVAAKTEQ